MLAFGALGHTYGTFTLLEIGSSIFVWSLAGVLAASLVVCLNALRILRPAERYRPSPRSFPNTLPQIEYDEGEIVRKLSINKATISFKGRNWNVPRAFQGELLAIRPQGVDGTYGIYFGANLIKTIDLTQ